jgi:EAL domain-containing protein
MNLTASLEHAGIASAILSLANALHVKIVAEGVETEDQAQWLRAHGCEVAQGYLFSRPLAGAGFSQRWNVEQARPGATGWSSPRRLYDPRSIYSGLRSCADSFLSGRPQQLRRSITFGNRNGRTSRS